MKAPTPVRRSRSNDRVIGSVQTIIPLHRELLAKLLGAWMAEDAAEREAARLAESLRIYHGPKASRGVPPSKLSDEQVLDLRRMRHWYGMTVKEIGEATGLDPNRIAGLCDYRNRVHLDPGPRPAAFVSRVDRAA